MKFTHFAVRGIVAVMVAAIAGLLYLQYSFLANIIELREQTFRQNVSAAMNMAADKMEEIDVRDRLFLADDSLCVLSTPANSRQLPVGTRRSQSTIALATVIADSARRSGGKNNQTISFSIGSPQHVNVRTVDILGRIDTSLTDTMRSPGMHAITLPRTKGVPAVYFMQVKTDSSTTTVRMEAGKESYAYSVGSNKDDRLKIIKRVTQSVGLPATIPFQKRFSQAMIDSIVSQSLKAHGIGIIYDFAVSRHDSIIVGRIGGRTNDLLGSEFHLTLPLSSPFQPPEVLYLAFPGHHRQMLSDMLPSFGLSMLLIGVIILCFVYSVRTITQQKEFAERLSDFINNMTHEFKTPISTITLATEAIELPEVATVPEKLDRYNKVIADEIARMKHQVEKILQMATLEEGRHQFSMEPLEMHTILADVAKNLSLIIAARGGSIITKFHAPHTSIAGDRLHIPGAINTILDNAIKYSLDSPLIIIETGNSDNQLLIRIQDHGIGIAKENLDKVFDKYYRVPTGNIHDVKGFGLGLSYVRLVAQAHGGTVTLSSQPGGGTTVELRFPVIAQPPVRA